MDAILTNLNLESYDRKIILVQPRGAANLIRRELELMLLFEISKLKRPNVTGNTTKLSRRRKSEFRMPSSRN